MQIGIFFLLLAENESSLDFIFSNYFTSKKEARGSECVLEIPKTRAYFCIYKYSIFLNIFLTTFPSSSIYFLAYLISESCGSNKCLLDYSLVCIVYVNICIQIFIQYHKWIYQIEM